jgi:hypothetical protein
MLAGARFNILSRDSKFFRLREQISLGCFVSPPRCQEGLSSGQLEVHIRTGKIKATVHKVTLSHRHWSECAFWLAYIHEGKQLIGQRLHSFSYLCRSSVPSMPFLECPKAASATSLGHCNLERPVLTVRRRSSGYLQHSARLA